ncbi:MAG TPA: hypothetical protein PLM33_11485 [Acidobacteriota bacterium]|jgi:hypothetical protein|nr:hypothetical protein [Acidobacteriota bacterium]HRR25147.1 hypothetical protein [Acidobacteriota bacterium]HRR56344.1 hypothetical protein [Acidobacteriota bacterium]HRV07217.1 hypothetical protein [Acidobacteriota bacterium]
MERSLLVYFVAWLIPGAGHALLRRWGRAILYFLAVFSLFCLGLYLDGRLFSLQTGFFGLLRFVADAAIGLLYVVGKLADWGVGDVRSLSYEYGNTFLYTAGLLNMLIILDTHDILNGKRS